MEASRLPQHLVALGRANEVRLARARRRVRIRGGEETVAANVLDCPPEFVTLKIVDLLMDQRRWGRARARRLLLSLALSEHKELGTFTQRQRQALADALEPPETAEDVLARLGVN